MLFWIIVGVIAGSLAKAVVPGEGAGGVLGDMTIGIVGAVIGGFIAHALGMAAFGFIGTTVVAFVGAVILLSLLRAFSTPRSAY